MLIFLINDRNTKINFENDYEILYNDLITAFIEQYSKYFE